MRKCTVCLKKRKNTRFGGIVIYQVIEARKRLKIKDDTEIGWNGYVCPSCIELVKSVGEELLKKGRKPTKVVKKPKSRGQRMAENNNNLTRGERLNTK